MTKHDFHNALRKLLNIDGPSLGFLSAIQLDNFFGNPWRFFIECDDETSDKLWEVMFPPRTSGAPGGVVVDLPIRLVASRDVASDRVEFPIAGWSAEVRKAGVPVQVHDITEPYPQAV